MICHRSGKASLAPATNNSYSEGDFFAVPLKSGGYGIGIVVCAGAKGTAVGRFFLPVQDEIPAIDKLNRYDERDSVHIEHFRDGGLRDGTWKIIGQHPRWDSYEWPIPRFGVFQPNANDSAGQAFEVELDEDLKAFRQKKISIDQFRTLPLEMISSSKAAQITITLALTRPGWKRSVPGLD